MQGSKVDVVNKAGQVIGKRSGDLVESVKTDEELAKKVEEQKKREAEANKPKQGLGALAAALKKTSTK